MTPDGPLGPRRTLKDGILYIASRSLRPVVPTAIIADRFWSIKGRWTDLVIPKPFARVLLIAGKPIALPADLSRDDFPQYTLLLQQEMDRLNAVAERMIAGDETAAAEIAQRTEFPCELQVMTKDAPEAAELQSSHADEKDSPKRSAA
jgi:hypothetical protein